MGNHSISPTDSLHHLLHHTCICWPSRPLGVFRDQSTALGLGLGSLQCKPEKDFGLVILSLYYRRSVNKINVCNWMLLIT